MTQHPEQSQEERVTTRRKKRALRGHRVLYSMRNFVESASEAVG